MSWKSLASKAVRAGVRQGIGYMRRSGKDTTALRMVDSLLREDGDSRSSRKGSSQKSRQTSREQHRTDSPKLRDTRATAAREAHERSRSAERTRPSQRFPKRPDGGYPGDYTDTIRPVYAPNLDDRPDPGEIVWAWVPFEEDHSRGKDRPVLLIGRDGKWLLGLMLTSQDNVPGSLGDVHTDEHGARYINIGSGDWDSQRRPSEIRVDRVVRIEPSAVRREGAIMPMDTFSSVVDAVTA